MSFLNPLLLFGALTVSVPIIIHLLNNRRIKKVRWAAMQFLRVSVEKNQSKMNVEDLILLALRCLLLLLLALAFARPSIRSGLGGIGKGSETAVIVLDNSYSMSATDGVISRFDQAKKAAEQIIDALPGGSAVGLLLVSDVVRAAIPEPTLDVNLARKLVREAELSDRATNIEAGIGAAVASARKIPGGNKRIYILTDGQANGLRQREQIATLLNDVKAEGIHARWILVGTEPQQNIAVTNLRLTSALAAVDRALRFEIGVTNTGVAEVRSIPVALSVDDATPSDQTSIDRLTPGETKTVSLTTRMQSPGHHSVSAIIAPDHLPADDKRTIAVRAVDDLQVLLVDGDLGAELRDTELFYVANALAPVPDPERPRYFLKTRTIPPSEFDQMKLGEFEAVILGNIPDLSAPAVTAIENYVRRGGGLIIFPGRKTNAAWWNDRLFKQQGLLPAQLVNIAGKENAETSFTIAQKYAHPIVELWKDPAAGTLGTARFYAAWDMTLDPKPRGDAGPAQVIANFSTGRIAAAERTWGAGRVILFASTADTAWNDLPMRPAWVPLIHRALGSIVGREDEHLNLPVGGVFQQHLPPELVGQEALVVRPGAKPEDAARQKLSLDSGQALLRVDELDRAGAYDVSVSSEPPVAMKFATQSNADESQVGVLPEAEWAGLSSASKVSRWDGTVDLRDEVARERTGSEFWYALAFVALATAVAETVLGDRFSRPR
jgi:hypothetical protein